IQAAAIGDDEPTGRIHGGNGILYLTENAIVESHLGTGRDACRVEALSMHLDVVDSNRRMSPDHDELAGRIRLHTRTILGIGSLRIDLELGSDRRAVAKEPPAEDAQTRPVLQVAGPDHDEPPGPRGDRRLTLAPECERIDGELGTQRRSRRVVAP